MKTISVIFSIFIALFLAQFAQAQDFHHYEEGLTIFDENGKHGFINIEGKIVVPAIYDDASFFKNDFAVVKKSGKFGFIDKSGKEITTFQYDTAFSFSKGLAACVLNNKYGFINKEGKVVIDYQYDEILSPFNENEEANGVLSILKAR